MQKTTNRAGEPPMLMTLQQVSGQLGVPYTSARDLVIQGHLRRVQLGDSRRIWVERTDVERLIKVSTISSAA